MSSLKSLLAVDVLEDETVKELNASGSDLSDRVFRDCMFIECDFSEAKLSKSRFSECTFKSCNFSNTWLADTRFSEVEFIECKLAGLDFASCNQLLFSINLLRCVATYCSFREVSLAGQSLAKSELLDCTFENTDLQRADLSGVSLRGSTFERTNLEYADFRGAVEFDIDPLENRLKGAVFSKTEALALLRTFGIVLK